MDEAVPAKGSSEGSRGSLLLFAAGGIGIYVLLRILDPAIAYPLRHISSSVATFLLNALSLPATREGTVISTTDYTFDVNPDCSGSTSLRIMLTLGALWFGMYPNLTLGRRLLCLLLAAPIAVFCNALRVATLVFLGDVREEPVEGLPHELIGIGAFALAMAIVYLMTLLMAKEPTVRERSGPRAHVWFLVVGLIACYAPVIWETGLLRPMSASSPLLVIGHGAFLVIGAGLLVFAFWSHPVRDPVPPAIPCALFVLAFGLSVVGTLTNVVTISSISLLGVVFALTLYFRGWGFAFRVIPLLGIIFLGLPGAHVFPIERFGSRLLPGADQYQPALLIQTLLIAVLIVVFLLLSRTSAAAGEERSRGYLSAVPMRLFILVSFLGLLFQSVFNSQAASFDRLGTLELPMVLGNWKGADVPVSLQELEVIGRDRLVSRVYQSGGPETVHLLVSATGADRSRAHRPEYCMTARGWQETDRELLEVESVAGRFSMTKLTLERDGALMEMRYWFDDGDGTVLGTFAELYPADVTRRLFGRRTNWRVYRLFGEPGSEAIDEFIEALVN